MTEKVNDLHSSEDTITHSFASELVFCHKGVNKVMKVPNHLNYSFEYNAKHKHALVETKRLEKQEHKEEWAFREKENV